MKQGHTRTHIIISSVGYCSLCPTLIISWFFLFFPFFSSFLSHISEVLTTSLTLFLLICQKVIIIFLNSQWQCKWYLCTVHSDTIVSNLPRADRAREQFPYCCWIDRDGLGYEESLKLFKILPTILHYWRNAFDDVNDKSPSKDGNGLVPDCNAVVIYMCIII